MAVDTRNKRGSVIGIYLPWGVYPNPDGTIDQADRQQTARVYPGISAGEAVESESGRRRGFLKNPDRMMNS